MKLLLINYEYPPLGGGAGNATLHIAQALASAGHQVVVLTSGFGELPANSREHGVGVIRLRVRRARIDRSNPREMAGYVVAAARALPGLLRAERPDAAIVFFSIPCGPLGLFARLLAGVPYAISLRGGDVPGTERRLAVAYRLLTPLRRLVMRRAVAVIANSDGLKALSERADPIDVAVIPNGVDAEFFVPAVARRHGPFTFLFVGRFQAQKNLALLLEAMARIRQEVKESFRAVFVGDGPERVSLREKCTALRLDDVVVWNGWCEKDELLRLYQSADCFVNPSLYEGMPNAVLEAMACGLPVIASNVAGNDAVVIPNGTGFLVPLESGELARAMATIMNDRSLCRRFGSAARDRAVRDYSWTDVARQYVEVLRRC